MCVWVYLYVDCFFALPFPLPLLSIFCEAGFCYTFSFFLAPSLFLARMHAQSLSALYKPLSTTTDIKHKWQLKWLTCFLRHRISICKWAKLKANSTTLRKREKTVALATTTTSATKSITMKNEQNCNRYLISILPSWKIQTVCVCVYPWEGKIYV